MVMTRALFTNRFANSPAASCWEAIRVKSPVFDPEVMTS
jgi:hypothetical protein